MEALQASMLSRSDQLHAVHDINFRTYPFKGKHWVMEKEKMKICILWSFGKMENPTQQPRLKHVLILVASSLNYFVSFFSSFNFDTKELLKIIIQQFLRTCKAGITKLRRTKRPVCQKSRNNQTEPKTQIICSYYHYVTLFM